MAAAHDDISPELADWIAQQPMFFVATAPANGGHVNVSPKGLDTVRVLDPHCVAYLDLTGSGIETIAHLRENGRITLMWCAFWGNPRILRVYGHGTAHEVGTPTYESLLPNFEQLPGARAIITVAVDRVSTSCGYAVPLMTLESDRDRLIDWALAKGEDALPGYRKDKNARSIDDLPGWEA
jgi:hypothetical protein